MGREFITSGAKQHYTQRIKGISVLHFFAVAPLIDMLQVHVIFADFLKLKIDIESLSVLLLKSCFTLRIFAHFH